ncbi:phospholipase D-like domain-containing protein [Variovorax sp. MHTC-1]|uniref:phospholipase D-like domain-containing protein n=1 Tax=Variovorax sp. MHTC-1 TaxID=2495593 RepID=UPI000F876A80|nr:phospholipase D family protein [Variovorax sp. MHTC-1]RST55414.1 phospholipase D family protein [Variovorax sp. MHTC-1]
MTSLFPRCPLLIAHCVGLRLIALAQAKADPRLAVWAFVVVLFGMLTACAGLPSGVQRPSSQARTDVADTRLAAVAAASLPAGNGQLSGMRLLPAGDQAFEARIALVRAAEKSIDVQYYQIADDLSGRQFLRGLADAAARGVRVRLLVDDLHAAGQDALLAGLAARPNLELRMFNPLAVRDGGVASRVLFSLHEFSRVNRRMHNKLLVADNVFAITGGRNIANEYFGRSEPANFIDMDMFAAGSVVRELSMVFDGYWNSEHAYPIQSLAAAEFSSEASRGRFDDTVRAAGAADLTVAARDPLGQSSVGSQLANGRLELHIAAARVIADAPAKAAPGDASLAYGAVMNGKLELMQSARSEVLVASPYFVPGRRTLEILKQATDNRVRVSVITNSLATTDEPLAHFGYARYRGALLQMGVSLFELMPGAETRDGAAGELRGSLGRLHAKVAVVDQRWLYIGSLNMDRRSAHSNTEMGLIVDSPELAGQVASLLQGERLPRSYQVRSTADQPGLQWVAQDGQEKLVFADEPNSNWGQRLRLSVVSMFVDEELL